MKQCLLSVNHEQFPIQMKQDNKDNNWLEILDFQPKLFWRTPTKLHRQLPKLNKFCLKVQLDPAHQVIKKLKWIICESTRRIPLHDATATECDKENKKSMPVTEILNTCT